MKFSFDNLMLYLARTKRSFSERPNGQTKED